MSLQDIIDGEKFTRLAFTRKVGESVVIADARGVLAVITLHRRDDGRLSLVTSAPLSVRVDRGETYESRISGGGGL